MRDIAHLLRPGHLQQLANILDDPEASDNDRFVALDLLKNATSPPAACCRCARTRARRSSRRKKGQFVVHRRRRRGGHRPRHLRHVPDEQPALQPDGPARTCTTRSTPGNNLPAEIKISAIDGDAYKFLFMAKGGGCANKSYLFQETKALLNEKTLLPWLFEKMKTLGTAACPPYHLAVVIGGTSAEMAVETAKLASTRYLDTLPTAGNKLGHAFRDIELEAKVLAARRSRRASARSSAASTSATTCASSACPRHGASCPVGMAVSCSADRQALGKITARRHLPRAARDRPGALPARGHPRRPRRRRRSCTSTSTGRWPRSAPS